MEDEENITIDHFPELIGELRGSARELLRHERHTYSVRPTALVISALRRQLRAGTCWDDLSWDNRLAFFSSAHLAMRNALVDYARRRAAHFRPKLEYRLPEEIDFLSARAAADEQPERILALEEALVWLEAEHPELASVVQHHYFTGISVEEIAALLEKSDRTVKRRLREARLTLQQRIGEILVAR